MSSQGSLSRAPEQRPIPSLGWRDQMRVMGRVLKLLWPESDRALKLRVLAALALVAVAKVASVLVPILYKLVVDALSAMPNAAITVPVVIVLGYGLIRVIALATDEIRDMIFSKVQERALRLVSVSVLKHLHELSLRFHLERQTGGLSRAIERGTEGIEFLVSYLVFHIAPILLEIVLVAAVLWRGRSQRRA
jgi:ATP-binding cassette, subfamily B, heavy metal transporter